MKRRSLVVLCAGLAGSLLLVAAGPSRASFRGANGQIVVAEKFDGVGLDTLDPEGTNSRRIWTATSQEPCGPCAFGDESNPSWSPDGSQIVFEERVEVEIQGVAQGIAIVNADGSNFHWLVQSPFSAHETEPHWSPDGATIVFERTDGTLALIPAVGGAITPLTSGHQPDWAPNGSRIAFAIGGEIHLINPDGTDETPLTAGDDDAYPSWSPDSRRLLFVRHQRLWVMDADGSNQVQLLDQVGVTSPAWSPDGRKVVFAVSDSYILDLASGAVGFVSGAVQPDWGTHPLVGPPPPPPPPPPPVVKQVCRVPRLFGRTLPGARRALAARHCRLGRVNRAYSKPRLKGRVIAQWPRAGVRLALNGRVRVVRGRGPRR